MKLYVGEYSAMHTEPCIRTQVLDLDEPAVSEPFDIKTRAVRLYADGPCRAWFGKDAVVGAGGTPIAKAVEWIGVQPGHRIAAEASGTQSDGGFAQMLALLTDPKATQARCAELAKATEASAKAAAEARAATAEAVEARAVLGATQHDTETGQAALEALRAENVRIDVALKARTQDLDARVKAHVADVAAFQQDHAKGQATFAKTVREFDAHRAAIQAHLDNREKAVVEREAEVAAGEAALKAAEDDYADRVSQLENLTRRKRA